MYHRDMFKLVEQRFADYFKGQAETGMGYWIATAFLKDGRAFKQVVIDSGYVTKVRGHLGVPFCEAEVDRFAVTHDKWKEE
jgi:hypothetical protein